MNESIKKNLKEPPTRTWPFEYTQTQANTRRIKKTYQNKNRRQTI